jgi:hypothetical protein
MHSKWRDRPKARPPFCLYNGVMGQRMDDKKRIEFAKQIEYMYEATNPGWRKLLTFAFLRGIATGFGIFLGGTIVVAIVLWILSGLSQIPFLNEITNQVKDALEQ